MRIIAQVFQFVRKMKTGSKVAGLQVAGLQQGSRAILWSVGGSLRVLEVGYGC